MVMLDQALSTWCSWGHPCSLQGGWISWLLWVPSNSNNYMILWFSLMRQTVLDNSICILQHRLLFLGFFFIFIDNKNRTCTAGGSTGPAWYQPHLYLRKVSPVLYKLLLLNKCPLLYTKQVIFSKELEMICVTAVQWQHFLKLHAAELTSSLGQSLLPRYKLYPCRKSSVLLCRPWDMSVCLLTEGEGFQPRVLKFLFRSWNVIPTCFSLTPLLSEPSVGCGLGKGQRGRVHSIFVNGVLCFEIPWIRILK